MIGHEAIFGKGGHCWSRSHNDFDNHKFEWQCHFCQIKRATSVFGWYPSQVMADIICEQARERLCQAVLDE